jgi:hypothetical protein
MAGRGRQLIAMVCLALAAWFTVLPKRLNTGLLPMDVERLITPQLVGRAALVGALAAGAMLAVMAWRHRREWRARLSWPLLVWLLLCLVALTAVVALSQPPWMLRKRGLLWVAGFARDFDMRHLVGYAGLAVVVAAAWRERLSLPMIGLLLLGYGFVLEVAQEFVPTRTSRIKDLASNGLGITLGLSWVYLHDLLAAAPGPIGWRRVRPRASSRVRAEPRRP